MRSAPVPCIRSTSAGLKAPEAGAVAAVVDDHQVGGNGGDLRRIERGPARPLKLVGPAVDGDRAIGGDDAGHGSASVFAAFNGDTSRLYRARRPPSLQSLRPGDRNATGRPFRLRRAPPPPPFGRSPSPAAQGRSAVAKFGAWFDDGDDPRRATGQILPRLRGRGTMREHGGGGARRQRNTPAARQKHQLSSPAPDRAGRAPAGDPVNGVATRWAMASVTGSPSLGPSVLAGDDWVCGARIALHQTRSIVSASGSRSGVWRVLRGHAPCGALPTLLFSLPCPLLRPGPEPEGVAGASATPTG